MGFNWKNNLFLSLPVWSTFRWAAWNRTAELGPLLYLIELWKWNASNGNFSMELLLDFLDCQVCLQEVMKSSVGKKDRRPHDPVEKNILFSFMIPLILYTIILMYHASNFMLKSKIKCITSAKTFRDQDSVPQWHFHWTC